MHETSINDKPMLSTPSSNIKFEFSNEICTPFKYMSPIENELAGAETNLACNLDCKRNLFLDCKQKASDMLVQTLMKQKQEHLNRKSEPQSKFRLKSHPKLPRKRKSNERSVGNKNAKRKEIQVSGNVKIKIAPRIEFADLKMTPLKTYYIPTKISDIERKIDQSFLPEIQQNMETSSIDPKTYVTAYAALLHLTEAAESVFMKDFDQKFIQLSYTNVGTTFKIKISVS